MGKRRNERRLAAKIGAGRRVKLDLFAEPSGDLGGSSPSDEVEKDVDVKHDPELPNSPSSGERAENPLSLLGQYSDDELDDVSSKAEGEPKDSKQAKESSDDELEDGEICRNGDPSYQKTDNMVQERDSISTSASLAVDADDGITKMVTLEEKHHKVDEDKHDPARVASDIQTSGDVNSSWKMVLHEESNKYYYWNIVSGETSWEIPESLVQGAASTKGLESSRTDVEGNPPGDVNNTTALGASVDDLSAHEVGCTSGISRMKMVYEQADQESQFLEQSRGDYNQLLGDSLVAAALPCETSTHANYILPERYNGAVASLSMGSYEVHVHSELSNEQSVHLPSHLAKQSEALLEKLKLVLGSGIDSDRHVFLSKYIPVIEVRLLDIRALLPHGSTVLPFWVHTEKQLNELESLINTEIGNPGVRVSVTNMDSSEVNNTRLKGTCENMNVDENLKKMSPEVSSIIQNDADATVAALMSSHDKSSDNGCLNVVKTSVSSPTTCSHIDNEGGIGVSDTENHINVSSKLESQAGEDVDMDIDMEVEVPSPSRNRTVDTGGQLVDPSESFGQSSTSLAAESLVPETEFIIPPPPEEEWIPPPPPDDEGIPPPPPDEPPESCPPPPSSEPEAVQAIYGEQYNMHYSDSNVNLYGNPSVLSSGFYGHGGACQSTALNLPIYFATAPQPIGVPNPADASVYYGLENGSLAAVPLDVTTGSSSSQAAASTLGCDSLSTMEMTSVDASLGLFTLPNQIVDPSGTSVTPGTFSSQASATCIVSAPAIKSGKQHGSVPSSSSAETAAAEASAAVSKAQSKASRMKKPKVSVASSLRSNKKVSSLVDKWKAAKEELDEEEEQRETPLDILEKKRRRGIEEWRAQQISSGEAKENANFQPLGGDWRERVKRRRAKKEAATETSSVPVDDDIKQPDLKALSKDLPLGWKVYWDDSSRQVYYSNSITSETTWTRPTR